MVVQAKERGELPDKRRLSQILSKYQHKVEEHTASERGADALPSFHPAGDAVNEAFLREQERFTSRISLLASDCGITEEEWFQVGLLLLSWRVRALAGCITRGWILCAVQGCAVLGCGQRFCGAPVLYPAHQPAGQRLWLTEGGFASCGASSAILAGEGTNRVHKAASCGALGMQSTLLLEQERMFDKVT